MPSPGTFLELGKQMFFNSPCGWYLILATEAKTKTFISTKRNSLHCGALFSSLRVSVLFQ